MPFERVWTRTRSVAVVPAAGSARISNGADGRLTTSGRERLGHQHRRGRVPVCSLHEFLRRLHTRFTLPPHLPAVPVMSTNHPGRLAMQTAHHDRIRLGALGLGLSALLLTVFPLARPFFRMNIFAPEETIAAASPALVSAAWVLSHYLAMLGFVLLLGGMLALYALHAGTETEPRAFRGLLWGILGVALILPAFGGEAFTMPVIGKLHLNGATGLA